MKEYSGMDLDSHTFVDGWRAAAPGNQLCHFYALGLRIKPLNLLVPVFLHQQKSSLNSIPCLLSRDGQMRNGSKECSQNTVNLKRSAKSILGTTQICGGGETGCGPVGRSRGLCQ